MADYLPKAEQLDTMNQRLAELNEHLQKREDFTAAMAKLDSATEKAESLKDGFSPTATVTQTSTGATVTITDKAGTTTAEIKNGEKGADGTDGFSPTATVTQTSTGADISITDKNGTTSASVKNGSDANVTKENVVNALGYTPLSSADGSVSNAHLADSSVTTDKLAEGERMTSANVIGALGFTPADSDETYELINSITTAEETEYFVWDQDLNGKSFDLKHGLIKTTSPESMTSALRGSVYWRGSANGSSNIVILSSYQTFFGGTTAGDIYYWIHRYGQRVETIYNVFDTGNRNSTSFNVSSKYVKNPHITELRFYFSPKIPAGATIELYGIRA